MARNTEIQTENRTVTLKELTKYAKHHFRTKRPFFVWGPFRVSVSQILCKVS